MKTKMTWHRKWLAGCLLAAAVCLLTAVNASAAAEDYDPYDDPFWQDLLQRVHFAGGGAIQADATAQDGDYVPFFILDGLRGKYLSLELTYCGQVYTLAGPHLPGLQPGVSVPFAALQGGAGAAAPAKTVSIPATQFYPDSAALTAQIPAGWQVDESDSHVYYTSEGGKLWFAGTFALEAGKALEDYAGEGDDTREVVRRGSYTLPDGRRLYHEDAYFIGIGSMDYPYGYSYLVEARQGFVAVLHFYGFAEDAAMARAVFDPIAASVRAADVQAPEPAPAEVEGVAVTLGEAVLAFELPKGWRAMPDSETAFRIPGDGELCFAGWGPLQEGEVITEEWGGTGPPDPEAEVLDTDSWGTGVSRKFKVLQRIAVTLPDGRVCYGEYLEFVGVGLDYAYGYCYVIAPMEDTFVHVYFYTQDYDLATARDVFEPIVASIHPAA